MATIALGSLTDLEKTYHVREALQFAKPKLVWNQFGQREKVPAREGKVAQWIRFDKFGTTSGSDFTGAANYVKNQTGTPPTWTPANPTDTTVTAQLDDMFGRGVEWNESAQYTLLLDLPKEMRMLIAQHAAEVRDIEVRDVVKATTNKYYPNSKTARNLLDSNDIVDFNDIIDLLIGLRANDAISIDGKFPVVHSPYVTKRLLKDSDFRSAMQFQGDYQFTGQVANLLGGMFHETTHAPYVSDSGSNNAVATVDQIIAFGAMAFGVTTWQANDYNIIYTGPGGHGDEWARKHKLTWWQQFKAVILNDDWLACLEVAR